MFLECCEANEGRTAMYHEAGELTVHLRLQGCTGHGTEALCSLSIEAIVEDWSDISQMCSENACLVLPLPVPLITVKARFLQHTQSERNASITLPPG